MRCKLCSNEGANASGFHPDCFTKAIGNKVGSQATRFEFATGRTVNEDRTPPGDLDDWEERLEEEQQKRREEEAEKEKERKAREDEARKNRAYSNPFFSSFFGGFRPQWDPPKSGPQDNITVDMDRDKVVDLLKLCHPDKHGNSELAAETTKWLNGLKDKLDGKDD
jgi:hypothetical protein